MEPRDAPAAVRIGWTTNEPREDANIVRLTGRADARRYGRTIQEPAAGRFQCRGGMPVVNSKRAYKRSQGRYRTPAVVPLLVAERPREAPQGGAGWCRRYDRCLTFAARLPAAHRPRLPEAHPRLRGATAAPRDPAAHAARAPLPPQVGKSTAAALLVWAVAFVRGLERLKSVPRPAARATTRRGSAACAPTPS
jgi:hypothetical protein